MEASSLIGGMESLQQAAQAAVTTLRHRPLMAEDFGAQSLSPQVACLTDVRQSDLVVLILGEKYGFVQPSGLSATHGEYREARGRKPVLAFVHQGIQPDQRQTEFLAEVESWESGIFREKFSGPEDLQTSIIRALPDHELTIRHSASRTSPSPPASLPGSLSGWRTLKQRNASPHHMTIGGTRDAGRAPVQVSRPRAALRLEAAPLAEAILVMLRRQFQD
ncbi:MAG: DUF4062 domain-containing protein [Acidobacteriia bacterium]|nr:DUF4062 domain-containing protein [Terriglobia bacterium]